MNACPDFETLSAFLDGEARSAKGAIAAHVATCAACQREIAALSALDQALRADAMTTPAPAQLAARLDDAATAARATPSRRAALVGLGAAASLAALMAGPALLAPSGALAMDDALFRDFSTRFAADMALDFPTADPSALFAWFDARLPFVAPRPPGVDRIAMRGGRLCWLLERRVAAVHFDLEPGEACLYAAASEGLRLDGDAAPPEGVARARVRRVAGAAGAFWRDGALAFALVAAPADGADASAVARRLFSAAA